MPDGVFERPILKPTLRDSWPSCEVIRVRALDIKPAHCFEDVLAGDKSALERCAAHVLTSPLVSPALLVLRPLGDVSQ